MASTFGSHFDNQLNDLISKSQQSKCNIIDVMITQLTHFWSTSMSYDDAFVIVDPKCILFRMIKVDVLFIHQVNEKCIFEHGMNIKVAWYDMRESNIMAKCLKMENLSEHIQFYTIGVDESNTPLQWEMHILLFSVLTILVHLTKWPHIVVIVTYWGCLTSAEYIPRTNLPVT